MTNKPPEQRMNDLELTVRTIDDLLPDLPTKSLQKWKSILTTTLLKIDRELTNTCLHTCRICFLEEWGYRDELPTMWYKKGEAEICFNHEYETAETLLRDAGYTYDAEDQPEIPPVTVEGLRVHMEKNMPPTKTEVDHTLQELMDEL